MSCHEGGCIGNRVKPMMNHSPLSAWADKAIWRWPVIGVLGVVALIGCYGLVGAMDTLEDLQAMDDARDEALRYEQVLIDQAHYLQMQCGGPESTAVEKAGGGWYCLDINGRKTKTIPGLARPVSQGPQHAARVFGARLQLNFECANSFCETESAGMAPAGFLRSLA